MDRERFNVYAILCNESATKVLHGRGTYLVGRGT